MLQGEGLGFCIEIYCCPAWESQATRWAGGGRSQDPEVEEEEESGIPGVPKAPKVKTGKRHVSHQAKPTQHIEASSQDASVDLNSRDSSDFRLLPDRLLSEDSSEEDEVYTDSLTSHTTALIPQ